MDSFADHDYPQTGGLDVDAAAPLLAAAGGDDHSRSSVLGSSSELELRRLVEDPIPVDVVARRRRLALEWSHLSFEINGKQVLQNCYGKIYPGQVTALVGPSGAGKSTLMNLLAARQKWHGANCRFTGNVRYGRRLVTSRELKDSVSYVMQQEALLPTETAEEQIRFAAALRTPLLEMPEKAMVVRGCKAQRYSAENAERVIEMLGLESVRHTLTVDQWAFVCARRAYIIV